MPWWDVTVMTVNAKREMSESVKKILVNRRLWVPWCPGEKGGFVFPSQPQGFGWSEEIWGDLKIAISWKFKITSKSPSFQWVRTTQSSSSITRLSKSAHITAKSKGGIDQNDTESFPALLIPYVGNPPVTGGFPSQRTCIGLWCFLWCTPEQPGPRLNIKTVLSTYGDFHVKDKTAVRTSYL